MFEILICLFTDLNAALIPVSEFAEPAVMKKYEFNPEPQVIDIVQTAARQKNVWFWKFFC